MLKDSLLELKKAKVAAEEANLAKSDFLSSMSHELRSPLNAILGFAQLMETGVPPPTPRQKDCIDQILQAGWYLLALINEILDLALIESGRLSLSPEPMSLAEVLADCQAMIEPQAQQNGIRVYFPVLDGPWLVRADRTPVGVGSTFWIELNATVASRTCRVSAVSRHCISWPRTRPRRASR